MQTFIIVIRQKQGDALKIVKAVKTETLGITETELLYIEKQADQAALLAVDTEALIKEDRYHVIYKIERNCKHKHGLQWQFGFTSGSITLQCEDCKLSFSESTVINESPVEEITA